MLKNTTKITSFSGAYFLSVASVATVAVAMATQTMSAYMRVGIREYISIIYNKINNLYFFNNTK